MSDASYIHKRLDSLHNIDTQLVASLDSLSSIISILREGKTSTKEEEEGLKTDFSTNIKQFYQHLSDASIGLRKEVKNLDDKISNNGSSDNDGLSILPININKKAVWTGDFKLKQEMENLDNLLTRNNANGETTDDNEEGKQTDEAQDAGSNVNEIVME